MRVNNGYIVSPAREMHKDYCVGDNTINVFQTMKALQGFIENHFSDSEGTLLTTEILAREYAKVYGKKLSDGMRVFADLSRYSKAELKLSLEEFSKRFITQDET